MTTTGVPPANRRLSAPTVIVSRRRPPPRKPTGRPAASCAGTRNETTGTSVTRPAITSLATGRPLDMARRMYARSERSMTSPGAPPVLARTLPSVSMNAMPDPNPRASGSSRSRNAWIAGTSPSATAGVAASAESVVQRVCA